MSLFGNKNKGMTYNLLTGYSRGLDIMLNDPSISWKQKVSLLIQKAVNEARNARKNDALIKIENYRGIQLPRLEAKINEKFKAKDDLKKRMQFYNVTKLIIDKISFIYEGGVTRDLLNGKGENVAKSKSKQLEKEQELFNKILSLSNWANVMKSINTYTNVCGNTAVRVFWLPETSDIRLDLITPDLLSVIENVNDVTQVDGIVVEKKVPNTFFDVEKADDVLVHTLWSKEHYFSFIAGQTSHLVQESNPDSKNIYGIIPFVISRKEIPFESVWTEEGMDLVEAQDQVNLLTTQINQLATLQSFAIPVLKNYAGREAKIVIDPSIVIELDTSEKDLNHAPEFSFVSPQTKIAELTTLLKDKIESIAKVYGLNQSDLTVSSASSGYALTIMNRHLDRLWQLQHGFYEQTEKDMFEIVKKVWNYHRQTVEFKSSESPLKEFANVVFSDDTTLNCTIHEQVYPQDPVEMRDHWDWLIQKGFATQLDYLIEVKGMEENEAIAKLEKTKKYKEENQSNPFENEGLNDKKDNRPNFKDMKNIEKTDDKENAEKESESKDDETN